MSEREVRFLIEDILEACNKIINYTDGITLEQFIADEKTADATIRNFEIVGEAANRIPNELTIKYFGTLKNNSFQN